MVKVQSILRQPVLSVSGSLEAEATVHLAFQVPGQVAQVVVQVGQAVKKGDVIAMLDAAELRNSLVIAEAKLNEIQRKQKRLAILYQRGSLTLSDMDKVDAALAENSASTAIVRKQVADTVLYASMDGVVAESRIEPGSVVAPGQPVCDLVQINRITAVLHIPETDIEKVHRGQKVTVRVVALKEQVFTGSVDELLPVADLISRTFIAKIKLSNDDGSLHPGSIAFGTVFLDGQEQILVIPGEAIRLTPAGMKYVYILAADRASVRRTQIAVQGLYQDQVIVVSGLHAEDTIVTAGQNRLSNGTVVQILESSETL